jgi:serine/threonine protein kinase
MNQNNSSNVYCNTRSNVFVQNLTVKIPKDPIITTPKNSRYIKGKRISKTLYGGVYHCVDTRTNQSLCMKVSSIRLVREATNTLEDPIVEIKYLEKLKGSKLIVGYHTSYVDDDTVYVIMDYYPKGDLYTYIKNGNRFNTSQIISLFKQMLDMIELFKSVGCANLDISCENFLIESIADTQVIIRCIDLGCMYENNDNGFNKLKFGCMRNLYPGKLGYISPELFYRKAVLTTNVDLISSMIYMMGITMFICVMTVPPYSNIGDEWYNYIHNSKWLTCNRKDIKDNFDIYGMNIMYILNSMIKPESCRINYPTLCSKVTELNT